MQVKLGPLVTDAAGSIGGSTFQRNFVATQVRVKPLPTLRRTVYTDQFRTRIQELSRMWRLLTALQRADWQATADTLVWLNKFGDVIRGKGYWLYIRCNTYLMMIGQPDSSAPTAVQPLSTFSGLSGDFSAVSTWPINWTLPAATYGYEYTAVFASRWASPGRTATFGGLRFIGLMPPGSASGVDMYPDYVTRFGQAPPPNMVVFTRLQGIDKSGGYQGPPADYIAATS